MRLFSIIQTTMLVQFAGSMRLQQSLDFSQDADDSSIVRLRITPPQDAAEPIPDDAEALEFTFDRNGRVRDHRSWPMRYPAWDKREAATIEKDIAASKAEPVDPAEPDVVVPVPESKFKRR